MASMPSYSGPATLERAIAIASILHEGQVDKAGAAYILHPLRVMVAQTSDEARMVAVLHDTVEDCGVTIEDLRDRAGFPESVLHALSLVTRRKEDSYGSFVERCATDPLALAVKLADLEDNLDIRRLSELDDKGVKRIRRYLAAHRRLSAPEAD